MFNLIDNGIRRGISASLFYLVKDLDLLLTVSQQIEYIVGKKWLSYKVLTN